MKIKISMELKEAVARAWLHRMILGKWAAIGHEKGEERAHVSEWMDYQRSTGESLGYVVEHGQTMKILKSPKEVQDAHIKNLSDYSASFVLTAPGHLALAGLDFDLMAEAEESWKSYMESVFELDAASLGYFVHSGSTMLWPDPDCLASASVLVGYWLVRGAPAEAYRMEREDSWDESFCAAGEYCAKSQSYLQKGAWVDDYTVPIRVIGGRKPSLPDAAAAIERFREAQNDATYKEMFAALRGQFGEGNYEVLATGPVRVFGALPNAPAQRGWYVLGNILVGE